MAKVDKLVAVEEGRGGLGFIEAAGGLGNDAFKGFFGNLETKITIPNVVAAADRDRDVIDYEKDVLNGLHAEITSSALSNKGGIYVVGNLARKYSDNDEMEKGKLKSEEDQPIIVLLTMLAYYAASTQKTVLTGDGSKTVNAVYALSTGLPLAENSKRKEFRKRIKGGTHQVTFLHTPELEGITVNISFNEVTVNVEGFGAFLDLIMDDRGKNKNPDLIHGEVVVNDIGGQTTDTAVISNGDIDNHNSQPLDEGCSPYLDDVIKDVRLTHGYRIKSRRDLVDLITHKTASERYIIMNKGVRVDIQPIVDKHLMRLARIEYKHIENVWNEVGSVRKWYNIGGGSVVLKPYIEKLNEKKKYPLEFLEEEDSIWTIARSYYKVLQIKLKAKGLKQE